AVWRARYSPAQATHSRHLANGEWRIANSATETIRHSLFTIRCLPDRKPAWLCALQYRSGESLSARLAPDFWAQDRDGRAPDRNLAFEVRHDRRPRLQRDSLSAADRFSHACRPPAEGARTARALEASRHVSPPAPRGGRPYALHPA